MNNQRRFKPSLWILACVLLNALVVHLVAAQPSSDDFTTITPQNASQLELGYILPGFCGATDPTSTLAAMWQVGVYDLTTGKQRFSFKSNEGEFSSKGDYFLAYPDGIFDVHTGEKILDGTGFFSTDEKYFAAAEDGVYDIATRKRLFPISSVGWFSPDSKLVAVQNDAMYAVKTGKRLFDLPPAIITFSPNSKYFTSWGHGLYDAATGKQLIASTGDFPQFSPNSRYLSLAEDGIYDVTTKNRILPLRKGSLTAFSPDSKTVAITGDGVYTLATQKRLFPIGGSGYSSAFFFEGSSWLGVADDGIYNLKTRQQQFPVSGTLYSATKNGSLISIDQKGIFDTEAVELKFRIKNALFAPNDKLVLSLLFTLDEPDAVFCAVYGVKGDKWPYRSGLVDTSHTQLYHTPSGEERMDMQGRPITTGNQLAVFAQTSDKQWYRVSATSWVKASDVKPISLPEGIPVENLS